MCVFSIASRVGVSRLALEAYEEYEVEDEENASGKVRTAAHPVEFCSRK